MTINIILKSKKEMDIQAEKDINKIQKATMLIEDLLMSLKSQKIINELFHIYTEHPDTLPGQYKEEIEKNGVYRTVTDFIAGMTDRFAIEEHKKLTDPSQRV